MKLKSIDECSYKFYYCIALSDFILIPFSEE